MWSYRYVLYLIGTLRSDNGNADENVGEKLYWRFFKLFLNYSKSPSYLK